jgi:carbamoyl-phosphate synthase large subunit
MKKKGGVLITVRDTDKQEILYVAEKFERLGFDLYATSGTASVLNRNMIPTNMVRKASEEKPNVMTLLDSGKIDYVISTSSRGRIPQYDSVKIRRKTVERSICCLTAIDTANAVADILAMGKNIEDVEMVDITKI